MDQKLILFIVAMIVMLVATIWIIHWQLKKQGNRPPKQNIPARQHAISRKLKRHGWRVFENVDLPTKNGTVNVSHIVVGKFGVIVAQSRGYSGEVYIDRNDQQWVHIHGNQREYFSNLLLQVDKNAAAVQRLFAQADIYRVEIHKLVVFPKRNLELYCPADLPVLTVKQLRKELRNPKYRKDCGVDIEKVCAVLNPS